MLEQELDLAVERRTSVELERDLLLATVSKLNLKNNKLSLSAVGPSFDDFYSEADVNNPEESKDCVDGLDSV